MPAYNTGFARAGRKCSVGAFSLYLWLSASVEIFCRKSPPSQSPKPLANIKSNGKWQKDSSMANAQSIKVLRTLMLFCPPTSCGLTCSTSYETIHLDFNFYFYYNFKSIIM